MVERNNLYLECSCYYPRPTLVNRKSRSGCWLTRRKASSAVVAPGSEVSEAQDVEYVSLMWNCCGFWDFWATGLVHGLVLALCRLVRCPSPREQTLQILHPESGTVTNRYQYIIYYVSVTSSQSRQFYLNLKLTNTIYVNYFKIKQIYTLSELTFKISSIWASYSDLLAPT